VQVAGMGRRAGWEALRRAKGTSVAEGLTGVACARTDDAGRGGLGEGSRQVCLDSSVGRKVSSKVLGKCWAWASPWAWAMAVAADTTLQLGLRRLDRAAEK
jgi:L-aminopeptidase/D-esterase-like protein